MTLQQRAHLRQLATDLARDVSPEVPFGVRCGDVLALLDEHDELIDLARCATKLTSSDIDWLKAQADLRARVIQYFAIDGDRR